MKEFNTLSSLLVCSLAVIQLLAGGFFFYFFNIERLSRKEINFFKQWGLSYILTSIGLALTAMADGATLSLAILSHILFFSGMALKLSSLLKMANRNGRFYESMIVIFITCLYGAGMSHSNGVISQTYLAIISVLLGLFGLGIAWAANKAFDFKSSFKKILSINFFIFALLHFVRAAVILTSTNPIAIRADNLTNLITYMTGVIVCLFGVFAVIGIGYEMLMRKKFTKTINRHHDFEHTMLAALNKIAHARSTETGAHTLRTQHTTQLIAIRLKEMGLHQERLTQDFIKYIFLAAPLHDIGKIAIPDQIIHKPGKLTEEEWELMKSHAAIGADILNTVKADADADADADAHMLLEIARNIAASHHEKWNGTGYPRGLKGNEIPIEARIMSIADQYDALLSKRSYKEAWLQEDALNEIIDGSGTFFDPEVVAAFMKEVNSINQIYLKYTDQD